MSDDPQQPADGDAEPVTGPDPAAEAPPPGADRSAEGTEPGAESSGDAAAPDADPVVEVSSRDADSSAEAPQPGADSSAEGTEPGAESSGDVAAPRSALPTARHEAGRGRRVHRPRAVDFSQPTKFTNEQQRRIARALDGFCQTASTRLSSELRTPLELEVGPASQVAWLMAQRQLPSNSLAVTLEVEPLNTRMLLAADLRLVLVAVECLLGGAPERAPEERRLSEIDWALIRRFFDTIVAQLSVAWQDLARLSLRTGDIESQAEAVQIASVSEPTLAFRLLTRIGEHAGNMTLLIPWQAIDAVAAVVGGRGALEEIEDTGAVAAIEQALSEAKVIMRAEVASTRMGIEDVLALREGSLVVLGGRVEAGVAMVVEDRVIARGVPGRHGQRRAVQIVSSGGMR